ncbi:MAG: adenylate/guanylate cyclase domain-containing protein [Rhodospirillaceae bacterium]
MIRKIRLTTGFILFAFVTSHLVNHALGIVSLSAMEAGRSWFLLVWRNPAGTAALYASLTIHILLAGWALYARRSLRMTYGEACQIVLGFSIPLLLALHIVGTRGAFELAGTGDSYAYVLLAHWKYSDADMYWQSAALIAAWVHGCIGLYYWLRLKAGFRALQPVAFGGAILLPVLGWVGYYAGGKEVLALAEDPAWLREALLSIRPPEGPQLDVLLDGVDAIRIFVVGLVAVALLGRLVRAMAERRRGLVTISYPDGRTARVPTGTSILEASFLNRIPHASVCGGRGRCSTCRVRIIEGDDGIPDASSDELRVLERVGAPPRVRLACQARPVGDLSVVPLLPPTAGTLHSLGRSSDLAGQERDIAILFADLRSFTQFSEKKLPYDVVFVLNRYFAQMGEAVERAGGHLDKFIGDGVMALFGTKSDIAQGSRDALEAARAMSGKLADLNRQLAGELDEPLRIGIGIHAGPAIIGEMGYGAATGLTAIGDSVNTASRLESMTKDFAAQLVFSEDVARFAGTATAGFESHEIAIRGRLEPVRIFVVKDAADLTVGDADRSG